MPPTLQTIKKKVAPALQRYDVAYAGIFGSVARGESDASSDVDMLVRFTKPKGLLELIRLERALTEAIGRDVDLVTEGSLSPYLRDRILRDLIVIYGAR